MVEPSSDFNRNADPLMVASSRKGDVTSRKQCAACWSPKVAGRALVPEHDGAPARAARQDRSLLGRGSEAAASPLVGMGVDPIGLVAHILVAAPPL